MSNLIKVTDKNGDTILIPLFTILSIRPRQKGDGLQSTIFIKHGLGSDIHVRETVNEIYKEHKS